MVKYDAPVRDMLFALNHVADLAGVSKLNGFESSDPESAIGIVEEAGKFFSEVWGPTNQLGDQQGSHLVDGQVVTPECFKDAYAKLIEAGWINLAFPAEWGAGGLPLTLSSAVAEMICSGNASLSMLPGLSQGAIESLLAHGDDTQKATYLPKMISGEWSGTMNLTEPEAGSDVGALRTKAVKADDGSYRIKGTKIYISFGDNDITENVIHLVLARTPDAPPGTKGISCFIVPKFLVNPDGSLGARNDVEVVSLEHKLGIKASPTCVMSYGDNGDGAIGYLIGEENRGMKYMFTMMNNARLAVGIGGMALGENAYQAALQYSKERVQGKPLGGPADESPTILAHADVRRMLLTMKAYVEAMRGMYLLNAEALDRSHHEVDDDARQAAQWRADLLTPITKAWCTDQGCEVASIGIQVFGGMGFVEETGVAQFWRDLRIMPIYEGTNGIQALDLIGRKLPIGGGAGVVALLNDLKAIDADLAEVELAALDAEQSVRRDAFAVIRANLAAAIEATEQATFWIMQHGLEDVNDAAAGATPYLRMFGQTIGGYVLAKAAVAAARLEAAGNSMWDDAYLDARIHIAAFYAQQLLPLGTALLGPVTAGKAEIFAIPDHVL